MWLEGDCRCRWEAGEALFITTTGLQLPSPFRAFVISVIRGRNIIEITITPLVIRASPGGTTIRTTQRRPAPTVMITPTVLEVLRRVRPGRAQRSDVP